MTPPLVTLEEHYYSPVVLDSIESDIKGLVYKWPGALDKLFNVEGDRLESMDRGKVALQVISHCTADSPSPDVCRQGNDKLAADIAAAASKKRFAAFAILPMRDPDAAAVELERAVKQLGFVGALVDHKSGDNYYDGPEYDVLWTKLQELDVPIYLHPAWPTGKLFELSYNGNYGPRAANAIGGAMWSWHQDLGMHILRLHAAGVFDRFPKLKVVIGHFGEMIPYMLGRIEAQEKVMGQMKRTFTEVYNENIWITTSGCWGIAPMHCLLQNTKIDRIMYSVDYPFSTNEQSLEWFEELEKSGLLSEEDLEKIAYKNAVDFLGLTLP